MAEVQSNSSLTELNERAKELQCLYNIDEVLLDYSADLDQIFLRLLEVVHPGWQYVDLCKARIIYQGREYKSTDFVETLWYQKAPIVFENRKIGEIQVYYTENPGNTDKPFLQEEQKLLDTISQKLSIYLFNRKLKKLFGEWNKAHDVIEKLRDKEPQILQIFQNSGVEEIVEYFQSCSGKVNSPEELKTILNPYAEAHWQWRRKMAEIIALKLDPDRFGVKAVYLFGSTKNAQAGPASDIDLLIHFCGDEAQKRELKAWLEGWSLCLAEFNFLKTGYQTDGLLDYHFVTDDDICNQTSFAVKINAHTDGAHKLKFREVK
ncbi:MAG: nucleotidyltransferase domain-containing protein [Candidatus Cloacimonetes bacterium]|nr:nucleotidyltransferase domain-containing protein [Candidatus Cloacimonadota bacterium]